MRLFDRLRKSYRRERAWLSEERTAFRGLAPYRRQRLLFWGSSVLVLAMVGASGIALALWGSERLSAVGNTDQSAVTETTRAGVTTTRAATRFTTALVPLEFRGVEVLIATDEGIYLGDGPDATLVPVLGATVAYPDLMGGLVYVDDSNSTFHLEVGETEPTLLFRGNHFVKVVSDRGSPVVVYYDNAMGRGLSGLNLETGAVEALFEPSEVDYLTSRTSQYWVWAGAFGYADLDSWGAPFALVVDDSGTTVEHLELSDDHSYLPLLCSESGSEGVCAEDVWITYDGRHYVDVRWVSANAMSLVVSDRPRLTEPYRVGIPRNEMGDQPVSAEIIDLAWPRVLVRADYADYRVEDGVVYLIDLSETPPVAKPLDRSGNARLYLSEPR